MNFRVEVKGPDGHGGAKWRTVTDYSCSIGEAKLLYEDLCRDGNIARIANAETGVTVKIGGGPQWCSP